MNIIQVTIKKPHYFSGVMVASARAIPSAHFVQTLSRSVGFEMNPISRRNARHFVSLTNARRPSRLVVSPWTHRPFIPVIRVYSCWKRRALSSAHFEPVMNQVEHPSARGDAESIWSSIHISPSTAFLLIQAIRASRLSPSGTNTYCVQFSAGYFFWISPESFFENWNSVIVFPNDVLVAP